MTGTRVLESDELEPLATGAWILGAGGGGSPYTAFLNLRELYRQGSRVSLIDPMELDDDDLVAVVSTMGAPLVFQERLTDPDLSIKPVLAIQEYLGSRFRAVMPIEIGGGNGLEPMLIAAKMDLPVVDADAMGRAFPEVQMTSFSIHGLDVFPMALGDTRDNAIVVTEALDAEWVERITRAVCTEFGSAAPTAESPRTGREVKECGILYSITRAINLGRTVHEARERHIDPVAAVLKSEGGRLMFTGKVHDVDRRTTAGFLRGSAGLQGLDDDEGADFEVEFQNEYLIGRRNGEATVTVPDIICLMDSETGEAVGTETLRYGQRIRVIALPAPPVLSSSEGLKLVGPRAFDYDLDYRPVFSA